MIEVDAGRTVDVVLTQGVAIDVPDECDRSEHSNVSSEDAVARRPTIGDQEEAMMRVDR